MAIASKEPRIINWKINQGLLFGVLLVTVLYVGRSLLVPFVSAAFFAMLLAPLSARMEQFIKRPFAVILCILLLLGAILGVIAIIIAEIISFTGDLPAIVATANDLLKSIEVVIHDNFGLEPREQVAMAKEQISALGKSQGSYLGSLLAGATHVVGALVVTLLYTFLMLLYRERYEVFLTRLLGKGQPEKTKEIIDSITLVGKQYIKGRTGAALLLWLFYATCFTLIGLKNGILLGAIASLIAIIPLVGGVIGGLFPFFMSLTARPSDGLPLKVVVVVLANALNTYVIEPMVVGGKLRLGALPMIAFIIIGGALWGIAGMILFIPLLAMAKILFDNIDSLKPFGYLVSDPLEGKTSALGNWASNLWNRVFTDKKKRIAKEAGVVTTDYIFDH